MKIRWKELTDREISLAFSRTNSLPPSPQTPSSPQRRSAAEASQMPASTTSSAKDAPPRDAWVEAVLARMDETPFGQAESAQDRLSQLRPKKAAPLKSKVRPLELTFSLRKVDEVAIVDGKILTELCLLCSRCGKAFFFPLGFSFSALFTKDPVMAGVSHLAPPEDNPEAPVRPTGQNYGVARTGGGRRVREQEARKQKRLNAQASQQAKWAESMKDGFDDAEELGAPMSLNHLAQGAPRTSDDQELDITFLNGDVIDLADVLSEQVGLQLPAQPLCQENCKGICFQCGTDLNFGRCACAQLQSTHPFAALRNHPLAKLKEASVAQEGPGRSSPIPASASKRGSATALDPVKQIASHKGKRDNKVTASATQGSPAPSASPALRPAQSTGGTTKKKPEKSKSRAKTDQSALSGSGTRKKK